MLIVKSLLKTFETWQRKTTTIREEQTVSPLGVSGLLEERWEVLKFPRFDRKTLKILGKTWKHIKIPREIIIVTYE